jgi:4-diphosphocytidyl-2-C-methyl-D-erythritol kinase
MEQLQERAPAKVNLWLRVLGRRTDGYHELETAMLALELGDELRGRATRSGGVELRVSGPAATPDIPSDERNLVWRVADQGLRRGRALGLLGSDAGLELELEKSVPSRAGLGGGSSDAAAALRLLERAWDVDLSADWRRETLAAAGADCVFFHDVAGSGAATCRGAGERVAAVGGPPPAWWVLVVTPEAECPTAEVFAAWRALERTQQALPVLSEELLRGQVSSVRELLVNDLEEAALEVVPSLARWRELLDAEGLVHARLTGSGSSFFALFDSQEESSEACTRLARAANSQDLHSRLLTISRVAGRS